MTDSRTDAKPIDRHLITTSDDVQSRDGLDREHIKRLASLIDQGVTLDPIDVFNIDGQFIVADGHHRLQAHDEADQTAVQCIVHEGSQDDAFWFGVRSNLRERRAYTADEKRRIVELAIRSPRFKGRSSRYIAAMVGVSDHTVAKYRPSPTAHGAQLDEKRIGLDGKARPASRSPADPPDTDELESWDDPPPKGQPDGRDHPDMDKMQRPGEFPDGKGPGAPVDAVGNKLTPAMVKVFDQAHRLADIQKHVQKARRIAGDLASEPIGAFLKLQQIDIDLKNVFVAVKFAAPYAVCPYCQGSLKHDGKDCPACKGTGWTPKDVYDRAPKNMKGRITNA